MLDAPRIAYLQSRAGTELLAEAARLPGDLLARLIHLRRGYPPEYASAALELLELRARAAAKFSRAAAMFFTLEGLEQSSGETIARWRAARFPSGATVLDLCCGIGGDALALGGRGPTLAFDLAPAVALCARANAEVYGVGETVAVACADVARLRLRGDAAFFDPSRRRAGRRVRDAGRYTPPLDFLHTLRAAVPDLAAKVSPALADAVLESFGGRVEFVSDRDECKEAVLWFGALGPDAPRSATLIPAGVSLTADPAAPPPAVAAPRAWLYEPDAAIVRAHLIAELAERLQASQIDPQIAYLTADHRVDLALRDRLPRPGVAALQPQARAGAAAGVRAARDGHQAAGRAAGACRARGPPDRGRRDARRCRTDSRARRACRHPLRTVDHA